ncbi:MAG: hypothetical protein JWM74_4507 [Myxococcaceae bacterium]|jgi:DNA-binding beta-propeller fold protein YncE|nr:hypothetical protein [Myxococcaceae bacterium]
MRLLLGIASLSLLGILACTKDAATVALHDTPTTGDAFPEQAPVRVPPGATMAFVATRQDDMVTAIDLATNQIAGRYPLDLDPVDVDGPEHLTMDPTGTRLFVVFSQPDLVLGPHAAHASKRGSALGSLDASRFLARERTRLSAAAYETALTPDASKLVVTHYDVGRIQTAIDTKGDTQAMRAPVLVLDPGTLATLATRDACILPAGIAMSADGTRAWIACYGEDVIGELHLDDPGFAFDTFPVGPDPQIAPTNARYGPLAVSVAAGGALFVSDRAGYDVRLIDLATHAPIAVLDTASGSPFSPASSADGAHFVFATREPEQLIAVSRSGEVWSKSASRELRAGECGKPGRAARWRDRWFVVCEASGALLEVDPDTLATRNTFLVGAEPTSVAFTPEGP